MRSMPMKGWCVFGRNSRTEWPISCTISFLRRDAIAAWKAELRRYGNDADRIWEQRIADGSIRVGKVIVEARHD